MGWRRSSRCAASRTGSRTPRWNGPSGPAGVGRRWQKPSGSPGRRCTRSMPNDSTASASHRGGEMARNDPARAAAILRRAREEATSVGSASVEAEHVLLAIAAHKGTEAQRILATAGLNHAAILEALDREFEESLAGAGVSLSAFGLPPASRRHERAPRWGTSFKLAVHRAPRSGP